VSAGFEKFRAKQVFDAVYKNKIFSPDLIPALPKKLKEYLAENFEFSAGKLVGNREAFDETRKYLFELEDGKFVECVLLEAPSDDDGKIRKTLCISTQVGCAS
jgi:23S rRNA (adenine2503-C2)-methyltransferase